LNLAGLIVGARESACRPMPRPRFRPDIGLEFPARSPARAAVQLPSICKTYSDLGANDFERRDRGRLSRRSIHRLGDLGLKMRVGAAA